MDGGLEDLWQVGDRLMVREWVLYAAICVTDPSGENGAIWLRDANATGDSNLS